MDARMILPILGILIFSPTLVEGQTGCLVKPQESFQNVSAACSRDVGSCGSGICALCNVPTNKCCGPVLERTSSQCPSGSVEYTKVRRCDCMDCDPPRLFVQGRITGDCTSPDCSLAIQRNGATITRATAAGLFSFVVDYPPNDRLVFNVVDDANSKFFDQIKVLSTIRGLQGYSIEVSVVEKSTTATFDATQEYVQDLGTNSAVSLVFPPNSVFSPNGDLYRGTVTAAINFIDPSDSTDLERIPAELITAGNPPGILASSGMLQIELTDAALGVRLTANGLQVFLKANNLGQGEKDGIGIWGLNLDNGYWELVTSMTITTEDPNARKRRRRQTDTWVTAGINLQAATQIWNLDALIFPYCHMKVRLFDGDVFSESTQASFVEVVSVYRRLSDSAWANYLRRYSYQNGICVSVACDQGGGPNAVDKVAVGAPGFVVVTPSVPTISPNILSELSYTSDTVSFTITIPITGAVIGTSGPIYTLFNDCQTAPFSAHHFRFARAVPEDEEINTVPIDEEHIFSPWINDVYSWWPNRDRFKACYIKVEILAGFGFFAPKVEVISLGGNHSVTQGKPYGSRTSQTVGRFACVEYKCPDILSDGEFDRTTILVIPKTNESFPLNLPLSIIGSNLYTNAAENTAAIAQIGNNNFTGPAPLEPITDEMGVYSFVGNLPKLAKEEARRSCFNGETAALTFGDIGGTGEPTERPGQ